MVIAISALLGCTAHFEEATEDGARYLFAERSSSGSGTLRVTLDVMEGETAMLATARVTPPYEVHVRRFTTPSGEVVFDASDFNDSQFSKTNAGFIDPVSTINWPVSAEDMPLEAGPWDLEFGVVDEERRFVKLPVNLDVLLKDDPDLVAGELNVALIYTDGLRDQAEVVGAVEAAQGIWQDLYAQAGITVSFSEFTLEENGLEPPAFGEDERYTALSSDTPARTVNVVLSEEVSGFEDILGISGDIPGPLIPTNRSAVQISTLLAMGTDGTFDSLDTRILAETMAHETAHFLGLYHPVEREEQSDGWSSYDVLGDTEECTSRIQCERALGENLMFPYPVCGIGTCTAQTVLSGEQWGVLNRYVGVR